MATENLKIIDLDACEPTDAEIVSWYEMMTAPDQLLWVYDETWAKRPTTPQKEIDAFRKRRAEQRGKNHPFWAIVQGKVVGMIGINRCEGLARQHCAEVGYGVAAAYTRRGIASVLLTAAIQKARQLGLKRLESDCFDNNVASIAVLRKFGFQQEGLRVGALRKNGNLLNQAVFGLIL